MEKYKWIYVCSPYSGENKEYNIKVARAVCRSIIKAGNLPVAPHLFFPQFLNDDIPEERMDGFEMAIYLLDMADEMWVVGETFSKGMKEEIAYASRNEIPVTFIPVPEIKEEEKEEEPLVETIVSQYSIPVSSEEELLKNENDTIKVADLIKKYFSPKNITITDTQMSINTRGENFNESL